MDMGSKNFSEGFAAVEKKRQRHGGKRSVYPSQGFATVKERRQRHGGKRSVYPSQGFAAVKNGNCA